MLTEILLIATWCALVAARILPQNMRIMGGQHVAQKSYPFMVGVAHNNDLECCGTLLTPTCVLTAAHCVPKKVNKKITVIPGQTDFEDYDEECIDSQRVKVKSVLYPFVNGGIDLELDIAVLQLASKMVLSETLQTVEVDLENELKTGDQVTVIGWGETGSFWEDYLYAQRLRAVNVSVTKQEECQADVGTLATADYFCAIGENNRDACNGDSGGPAMRNGKQVGIVSYGEVCQKGNAYPGGYLRLSTPRTAAVVRAALAEYCGS